MKKKQHYISKTDQEIMKDMNIVTDVEKNNMPGEGGATWKMKLDRDWFQAGDILNNGSQSYKVDSKVYTKWWQRIINKITFGLYKPTTFWYKIKPIEHE